MRCERHSTNRPTVGHWAPWRPQLVVAEWSGSVILRQLTTDRLDRVRRCRCLARSQHRRLRTAHARRRRWSADVIIPLMLDAAPPLPPPLLLLLEEALVRSGEWKFPPTRRRSVAVTSRGAVKQTESAKRAMYTAHSMRILMPGRCCTCSYLSQMQQQRDRWSVKPLCKTQSSTTLLFCLPCTKWQCQSFKIYIKHLITS